MLTVSEVALIVAGIALLGTAATVIQKRYTDRRDAWWGRTQWALQCVVAGQGSDDAQRTVGLVMLQSLQSSPLASRGDRQMIEQVANVILASVPPEQRRATAEGASSS